jgi:hypothetical protein
MEFVEISDKYSKVIFLLFFKVIFLSDFCFSQAPDWLKTIPDSKDYYIGIASCMKDEPNYQELAFKQALSILSEQISVKIHTSSEFHIKEHNERLSQNYNETIRISSNIYLQDYELVDSWEDKTRYYVFYRLSKKVFKKKLIERYNKAIEYSRKKIRDAISNLNSGNFHDGLTAFLEGSKSLENFIGNSMIQEKHSIILDNWNFIRSRLLKMFDEISMQPLKSQYYLSMNEVFDKELAVKTFIRANSNYFAVGQIPVLYSLKAKKGSFHQTAKWSNFNGICTNKIAEINQESLHYTIKCKIDFDRFFKNYDDYLILKENVFSKMQKSCEIQIEIIPLVFYIQSNELIYNDERSFFIIKDKFQSFLRKKNFKIVHSPENVDYHIYIKANTKRGSYYKEFFSAYLRIEYIIRDKRGEIIYDKVFDDIKGMGLNYRSAAEKAYTKLEDSLLEKELNHFLKFL